MTRYLLVVSRANVDEPSVTVPFSAATDEDASREARRHCQEFRHDFEEARLYKEVQFSFR